MRCRIHKWLISRSLDQDKGLPGFSRRHLAGCPDCRGFARFSRSFAERALRDADFLLEKTPRIRPGDILAKIELSLKTEAKGRACGLPYRPVAWNSRASTREVHPRTAVEAGSGRRRLWIPAVSAALVGLILIAAAVVLLQPSTPIGPAVFWDQIEALQGAPRYGGGIQSLADRAELSLEAEYESLKKAVETAARSLLARLDPKIDSKTS
jgi:hypothetical protein